MHIRRDIVSGFAGPKEVGMDLCLTSTCGITVRLGDGPAGDYYTLGGIASLLGREMCLISLQFLLHLEGEG